MGVKALLSDIVEDGVAPSYYEMIWIYKEASVLDLLFCYAFYE